MEHPSPEELPERLIPSKDQLADVLRFLAYFSRLEYALKRGGFLAENKRDGSAMADWNEFGKQHASDFRFDHSPEIIEACEYYFGQPPQKEMYDPSGTPRFAPDAAPLEKSLPWLTKCVRRTRNNLFHGGKYPFDADPLDPHRDGKLLVHGLRLLRAFVQLNGTVKAKFDNV